MLSVRVFVVYGELPWIRLDFRVLVVQLERERTEDNSSYQIVYSQNSLTTIGGSIQPILTLKEFSHF